METNEVSERYIAPCFVNGLEAYDGEINLAFDENLISNEFAVNLCLDYKVKKGNKVVKKVLIVALRGELYFFKFIINPKEDDVEPRDPFKDNFEKKEKSLDDWDHLLDFNLNDVPQFGEELPSFVCKMRKRNHYKKRAMENLNFFYQDIRPSLSTSRHLTQEEVVEEAFAIRISQKFALLEEVRPVIKTMTYHNKYKKVFGEASEDKDDPRAFIFSIRLEGKVNENALADTGSDINTMPYRIYKTLGREEMKKVGVTTIIAKFLILDIPIDRDAPIVDVLNRMGWDGEIDDMLRIRLRKARSNEDIFTSVAWIRAFNINEPIYAELCHKFYSTYEFDEVCVDDELQTKKIIKFRLGGRAHSLTLLEFAQRLGLYHAVELDEEGFNVYFEFISKIARKSRVLTDDMIRSLSASIYYRDLDTSTLRGLIDSKGRLIPEDPHQEVPRVSIPRPPRASLGQVRGSV
uniref:Uncharacterized protein n=1 Tax=Tanacetum cinerariifolium TaxID=118510 RepID=A0A6L2L179_TANCI|nr:hypothetical protein [Tanacetum cinerariifolium]